MAAPPPHPNLPDHDTGVNALIAGWVQAGVAVIVVALRTYTGVKVLRKLDIGDYLMIFSLVAGLLNTSFLSVSIHWGIGRHFWYLTPEEKVNSIKFFTYSNTPGIVSPTASRVSFALYLLKFVGTIRWRRWLLWFCIWTQLIVNVANIVIILGQCQPIQAQWDPIGHPGTCWSRNVQIYAGYAQGAFNCFCDVAVTALPIVIIGNLKMKLRIKFALGVLMTMSVFAFVAAVIKTNMLSTIGSKGDFTYDVVMLAIWFTIENYITIIAASVPTIRPLFLSWRKTTVGSTSYKMGSYGRANKGYMQYPDDRSNNRNMGSNHGTDIDKYTANVSIKPSDSADASSEENILPMQNYTKDITKTTRVDVRYEDIESQRDHPSRQNMGPQSYIGDHGGPHAL